ncbi:hypothetical protein Acsp06_03350 [Actinomycetospora sp. NBRC 106375]|uniref:hypothetical protein n=1 Tax=Actinomycetospora sp. NBRC 106375 TaxID=3032207 RepID=UPI0024A5EF69|nr:hypothetical protein [Actinomycetospora sp. NBRC 106375]GLZ44150.1 hypothetical protein Acsp06_03350 [Actinomycetospora sp. NBRC 106375]
MSAPADPRDPLAEVAAVADAVLLEGYLLYPYRASAQKNALRWQFGVLVPPATSERLAEPSRSRTELLLEPRAGAVLRVRVRFLQVQERVVVDRGGRVRDRLTVDDVPHFGWDEGLTRELHAAVPVDALGQRPITMPITGQATEVRTPIHDARGVEPGAYVRRTRAIAGHARLTATPVPGPYRVLRLRLDVVNDTVADPDLPRDEALRRSLVATHTVLGLDVGAFVSSADPPEWAAPAVADCVNEHSWPVLAGAPGTARLVLASPIILSDHPQLAPESPTDLFDGTENDEILSLRTLALTDTEKREARATDPRAADLLDALDAMGPEMFERLHGTFRPGGRAEPVPTLATPGTPWWDPGADASVDPSSDTALVGGVEIARGSTVVLRPGPGGDAQDSFLAGAAATVEAVLHDVDGGVHVAVSLVDDPGADLQATHGRHRYFRPDELEVRRDAQRSRSDRDGAS